MGARIGRLDLVRLVEQAQRLEDLEEAFAEAARALPADAAALVDFFEVPTGDAFDVPAAQAIKYFQAKGLKPTFSYLDMIGGQHDNAFTVAKMMQVDMLAQVRNSLDSALANGTSFKEWSDTITPILQSGGWWGRQQVLDPLTGQEIVAQLGSPWRLETIFRTNMQTAYAAGAWQEIQAQKEIAPFLMYDAIDDFRTRPAHKAWDQTVLPVDSTWWSSHYPPNGYNCRCSVIQLSMDEVEALGLTVAQFPPKDGSFAWTNPRTGEELMIPKGLDPGFVNNAGESWAWKSKQLLSEKIGALPDDMKAAALKGQADAQAAKLVDDAVAAAQAAQTELAVAQGKAALARAQALAAEKSAQWAAQQQLEAIAKADKAALGVGAQYKVKALAKLSKGQDWQQLDAVSKMAQVNATAAELKQATELASKVATYKKAVLDGKTPPPAVAKAFKALPEDKQQAVLQQIAEAQAKKAAAEAAAAKAAAEEAAKAAGAAKPSPAAAMIDPAAPNPASMVRYAAKTKGGQDGAYFQDNDTGKRYLVKFLASEDEVRNEVLASKLYRLAGVEAPELHAITLEGRPALASSLVDGIQEVGAATLAKTPTVLEGFAVDAWLANWDVVGMSFDNTVLVGGRALRIDVGGSLRYRALGGLKGSAFGTRVNELDSLRDGTNRQAAAVFGKITDDQLEAGVARVLALSEADIRAVVARYGPADPAVRADLADLLVARRADLERRFPAVAERVRAAQQQPGAPTPPRVTAAEQEAVESSRVNGYGFATDSDQIEDNMVVVHTFKRADGSDATRGFFKLLPGASGELRKTIAAVAGGGNAVPLGAARDAILAAVKSINYRADKGQALDATVVAKLAAAFDRIDEAVTALRAGAAAANDGAALLKKAEELEAWRKTLQPVMLDARTGDKAVKLARTFDTSAFPDEIGYQPRQAPGAQAGVKWRKVTGPYEFATAKFDRSFATETSGRATVSGTSVRYEATLSDGTKIVYVPHGPANAWAMQGVVKIDAPGRGIAATERIFGAIGEVGLKSTRASEVDRQILYLNAFARLRLGSKRAALSKFNAITETGDAGVRARLDFLRRETGVDIEGSDGWKRVDGVRQAFGHGRAYQHRPDLTAAELEDMNRTHVVFHNPQGLGTDSGSGVFERLKVVIDGGGMFASLTDRVRRGVPLAGSSVSSDLASGGGDYHFTRIRARASQSGTGVYWKASVLRRMDAITYESDMFGRTTGDTVLDARRGQDIASLKAVARSSSNETIFKGGLSIFDELDRIVLSSAAEVKEAIAWLKSRGYDAWPDGRKLEDVIMTKAKHSANP